MTIKCCVENGPQPVGREDVLNCVWPPTRVAIDNVHLVRALGSRNLTNDESNFLFVCRDMIILKYDPLLSI